MFRAHIPSDVDLEPSVKDLARLAREYGAVFSRKVFVKPWGTSVYVKLLVNDRWILVRASDHKVGIRRFLTDNIFRYVGLDGLREEDEEVLRAELRRLATTPPRYPPKLRKRLLLHAFERRLEKLEDAPGATAHRRRELLRAQIRKLRRAV